MPGSGELFDTGTVIARYEALREQNCDLTVFAGEVGNEGWQGSLPAVEKAVRANGGAVAFAVATNGCTMEQAAVLVTPDETVEHRAHARARNRPGRVDAPVTRTEAGQRGAGLRR